MSIGTRIAALKSMPYGQARTSAAESLVRQIEAEGPREHLAWALSSLVEAYTFGEADELAIVPFTRMLRLWDESPELFDDHDQSALFWEYKWIADTIFSFPQVSREQGEQFLDDMERRFRLAGHGLSAVAVARFSWAWQIGDPDAEAARMAWRATPRDQFDDCPACVIGTQVAFFVDQGRFVEALELGRTQDGSCNVEPAKTHHEMALAALLTGDAAGAMRHHRLALATFDGKVSELAPARGRSFEMLARGGQFDRALRTLRNDDVALLSRASSPLGHLGFLIGVLSGLSANLDRRDTPTGLPGDGRATVGELRDWVLKEAGSLAEKFDRRNGNRTYAAKIESAARSTRTEHVLDFSVEAVVSAVPTPDSDSSSTTPGDRPSQLEEGTENPRRDSGQLRMNPLARAERLAAERNFASASLEYTAAAAELESDGELRESGLAYAEAAQCAALAEDEERAHSSFELAVTRLIAGGASEHSLVEVLTAWAPLAVRMSKMERILRSLAALLTRLETPLETSGLTEELAERRRIERTRLLSRVRDALARCLASHPGQLPSVLEGSSAAAEATLAAEGFASIGRVSDAAHAFWLAARVQRDEGDSPAAIYSLESALEGFTLTRDRQHRAEAAGELIELLHASGLSERAEEISAELNR